MIVVEGCSRRLSEVEPGAFSWPASARSDPWLLVHGSTVEVVPFVIAARRGAVQAARRRGWRLFIGWTGQWRTDVFEADVLPEAGVL